jgi:hypothetical protein
MDMVADGNGHQDAVRDTGSNLDDPILRDMAWGCGLFLRVAAGAAYLPLAFCGLCMGPCRRSWDGVPSSPSSQLSGHLSPRCA